MSESSEAAEQVVRMSLEGVEVACKIAGPAAKDVAVLIYTIIKNNKKTKGKTNLDNMLKSGEELKVFSVKREDFKTFTEEAKKYGVLYSALIDKKSQNKDGVIDIMVRSKDAPAINRIVERFNLASYDKAHIKAEIERTREEKANPQFGKTQKSPQSEPFSKNKEKKKTTKKSVREELNKAKKEAKDKESQRQKAQSRSTSKTPKSKQTKSKDR